MTTIAKAGTFLILGAGQIGKAAAIKLFARKEVKRVIIHTLTEQEAKEATIYLEHHRPRHVAIDSSWGDILGPVERAGLDPTQRQAFAFDYYYRPFCADTTERSGLYQIIKRWRPEYIIDAVNTATIFGYHGKLYEIERALWQQSHLSEDTPSRNHLTQELLMAAFVPKMTRFIQVLERAMLDFGIRRYVKVSTTGLGGMGLNIPYTHGDPSETGITTRLLGKIAAAGILNQLLWNLSHTHGLDIRIVIPATLVGWEPVREYEIYHDQKSNGKEPLRVVEDAKPQRFAWGSELTSATPSTKKALKILSVGSGENEPYGLAEAAAISSSLQMGSITKEEVANATVETALGSDRHNILAALDQVVLGPSYQGAETRRTILEVLEKLEEGEALPSIVTGNLGPRVAKHLVELYLILKANRALNWDNPKKIQQAVAENITHDKKFLTFVLSVGLPVITSDDQAYFGTFWHIPPRYEDARVTKGNVEKWADLGWVDVRAAHIAWWIKTIKALPKERYGSAMAHENLSRRTGELLAAVYDNLGLGRK